MTAVALPELTEVEAAELVASERRAEDARGRAAAGLADWGAELGGIKAGLLYRTDGATWDEYCLTRWNISKRHADRLIEFAEVKTITGPIGPMIESQARELVPLLDDPDALREVWSEARERAAGRPTAATVREVVRERQTPAPESPERAMPEPASGPEGDPASGSQAGPSTTSPIEGPATQPDQHAEGDARRDAELDAAMAETVVRFRRNLSAAIARADDVWSFDVDRIAEVYAGDWETELRPFLTEMSRWCEQVTQACQQRRAGLRVVNGGRS